MGAFNEYQKDKDLITAFEVSFHLDCRKGLMKKAG